MSTEGGAEPVWARNGKELYFRKANRMIATRVNTDGGVGPPGPWWWC